MNPMGHCAALDAYTKCFDDAIVGVEHEHKCVDDTLLYDSSVEQAFWHAYNIIETWGKWCHFESREIQVLQERVEFMGFHLDWDS